MKSIILCFLAVISIAGEASAEAVCDTSSPDCVSLYGTEIATGDEFVSDFIVQGKPIYSATVNGQKADVRVPKNTTKVLVRFKNGQPDIVLGDLLSPVSFGVYLFKLDPRVSFVSSKISTRKQKSCRDGSFGFSIHTTMVYEVRTTTLKDNGKTVTLIGEAFKDHINKYHSPFKCPKRNG